MKFFIVTFGCKVNQYETQALREAWQAQGAVECSSPAEADVICINSCAITGKGERDARNAVYRLRREAPHAKIVLTGCAAKLVDAFQPRPNAPHERPDALEGGRITKLSLRRNNTIVYAYDGTVTIAPPDDNTRLALEILLHTENNEEG